ncbi:MAG: chromosomal replication initiator protein DnaA [Acidobacteriota bacterium]|nr:chromosomal replication initiator protein DnaA [Acidobacteriota bacterium]
MPESLWNRLRKQLETELDPEEFSTWIQPLKVASEAGDRLVLLAPDTRFLSTLESSYRPTVDRAIAGLSGPAVEVLFSLEEHGAETAQATAEPTRPEGGESLEDPRSHNPTSVRSLTGGRLFTPGYTFDTFVVGSSNQFAHAAAQAVAAAPFRSYNPLFLYGGVGLGKTHLLHAIGHQILASRPDLNISYLAAEQFVNDLISSLRFNRMPAFRERYRSIDVLLVDDIQFLANKERTQEEFFHTFNTLYSGQKQIILSSDSSPRNIPALEERLRSRFEWGLIADIQPPDLETKVAILRRKAETEGTVLPDDVAHFVAHQVRSNVRELEGLLNRVLAFASLTGRPVSRELAEETLRDILPAEAQRTAPAEIVREVARHYGLKVTEIKSRKNSQQIVFPRQVAMYLCKKITGLSFPEIGKHFNNKHHSTVMYSVEKIEQKRSSDPDLERTLDLLMRRLS